MRNTKDFIRNNDILESTKPQRNQELLAGGSNGALLSATQTPPPRVLDDIQQQSALVWVLDDSVSQNMPRSRTRRLMAGKHLTPGEFDD